MTTPVQIKEVEIGRGLPKICVPLTGKTESALCREAEMVKTSKPDLVEWRADFFADLFEIPKTVNMLMKLKEILGEIPVLFTVRTKAEGGNVSISMKEYVEINTAAARFGGADLIDVEVFSEELSVDQCLIPEKICLIERIHQTSAKVIASSHDFKKTDARELLLKRFKKMNESGADILKMAVMPECEDDVAAIMEITDEMRRFHTERPLVSMSMGVLGSVSRIKGEVFGSSITFASVNTTSAPGQIPIEELREKMRAFHEQEAYRI